MTDLQLLRTSYWAQKAQILFRLQSPTFTPRGIHKVLRQLSDLTDTLLLTLWERAAMGADCALLAVGGYGRAELFPYSDVDVLVLLPERDADDPGMAKRIEQFIGSCWDAGLEIGSSVRTVTECVTEAGKDVTVQTALLECRFLLGDKGLFGAFRTEFFAALDPQAFFVAKTLELRQRHTKFEDTPYSLEPNCKESPGGIRDLQAVLWVAKAAQLGRNWAAL